MLEYLSFSLKNLGHHKVRSFLTLLGVIIGIMAVVSMISIGSGMKAALKEQLEQLGSDKVFIVPRIAYGTAATTLTDDDADAIQRVAGVAFVSPLYSVAGDVEFRDERKIVRIYGIDPEKAEATFGGGASGYSLLKGRWIQRGDVYKVVVGYGVATDVFTRDVNVGNTLKIHGINFEVVGVFKKTGDREKDYTLYTDLDTIREIFGAGNRVTLIIARVDKGTNIDAARLRIERLLEKRKGSKENFFVMTQKEIIERMGEAYRIVQVVFGGLAAVSLIVGAIGIANTMIMNVTERTREIGILKATGASNMQVMGIFLADAALLGLVGGGIGVALGYAISRAINLAAARYLGEGVLTTVVSPQLVLFALSFSLVIGIAAGLYPAYRALKLNPVEALRA
ncbi:ABC transporter permease [Candidatus Pyrohabitans sp.]